MLPPLCDLETFLKFARQHRVPWQELAVLPESASQEDCECAVFVYQVAREDIITVKDGPDQDYYPVVKDWIDIRAFIAAKQRPMEDLEDVFIEERAVLNSLLPSLPGWEGPAPRKQIKTLDDLPKYLAEPMLKLQIDEIPGGEKIRTAFKKFALDAAACALRNAKRAFDHFEVVDRPSPWPTEPKDGPEAKRALSFLIQWFARTRQGLVGDRDRGQSNAESGSGETKLVPQTQISEPAEPTVDEYAGRFASLEPAIRKAYWAFSYAQTKMGRQLLDREAHEYLTDHGIDGLSQQADYDVPSLATFCRRLSEARRALGESKYTPRGKRSHGSSIVSRDDL